MIQSRRSTDCQNKSKRNTPIALSSINYDTCISLELPHSFACRNCAPTIDPLIFNRKKSLKKERHKIKRCRCQQYWSSTLTKRKTQPTVIPTLHTPVCLVPTLWSSNHVLDAPNWTPLTQQQECSAALTTHTILSGSKIAQLVN